MSDTIIYIDLGNKALKFEDVVNILDGDSPVYNKPDVQPSGRQGYIFKGEGKNCEHDYKCDQYRWKYKGKHTKLGVYKRYFHLKDPHGVGEASLSGFQLHVYVKKSEMENKMEAAEFLYHYIGDSSLHIDTRHGNAKQKTGLYLPTMKSAMKEMTDAALNDKTPKHTYMHLQAKASKSENQNRMPVDRPRDKKTS